MPTETQDLSIDVDRRGDVTIVTLAGEVDLATQSELRTVLNDLVVAGDVDLVLDLAGVSFIDSTGIGALIGTRRRVHAFQGSLQLARPSEAVIKVFTITGLDKVFDIRPTLEAAAS